MNGRSCSTDERYSVRDDALDLCTRDSHGRVDANAMNAAFRAQFLHEAERKSGYLRNFTRPK